MDAFDISRFDEYREDNRREVKKAKGGLPNSLWESYSSMANCNGGVIILGVREEKDGFWHTTGLENPARIQKEFWDTINNKKKVNTNLLTDNDVETYDVDGDVIMVIHVPRAGRQQRPIFINNDIWNGTYRRNWEGDYHCTDSEIRAMLRDEPDDTMDMQILEDFSLDDLSDETVQGYRNYHSAVNPGHVWEKLPKEEYLERIGAAGRLRAGDALHPTAAGLLMFGEEYRIVRYFPEYFLDYREVLDPTIRWTDRIQSSSGDWSGNLFDFFFRVYNKLSRDIEKPFALDGITRVDDTPVHKAVREALANCIVNTDFYLPRGIVILKEPDRIILQNPGYPNNIGIVRQVGGVPAFVQVYEENGFMYDIEDVKAAITDKTKILLINSPSNPTGGVATRENLEQLAQIAIENDLFVISDELYNELVWSEEPYTSIASLPGMKERTLIVDGFSKTYAMTGLRLGYGAGPAELIRNMTKLIENVASCVNEGIQYGGIAALEGDQQCVQDMRAEYIKRRKLVIDGLNSIDGISCVEPKGAFYAFANIKKTGLSSREFAIRLLKEGHVAVVPGYGFGTGGEGFVRLSYATSEENIEEGLRRIREFVATLK